MGAAMRHVVLIAFTLLSLDAHADAQALKNWFNDPFFTINADLPHCPPPRGPLLSESEMKAESHSCVERGTSCWMAGDCAQPNAYLYDAAIGKAIRERFAQDNALRGTALWVTVKRRFVWVEECVADRSQAAELEAAVKQIPDVERVLVNIMQGDSIRPPYRPLRKSGGQQKTGREA
jgi:hypothetical protein